MIDLDDERSGKIAEVLSNKTSKKILQALADGEKSGSEVAEALKIPLNTTGYNLKKLVDAGLVEKSKGFFWSQKGKKMEFYKIANKKIVIMPKQMVKGILPAVIVTGLAALGIKLWTDTQAGNLTVQDEGLRATAFDKAVEAASAGVGNVVPDVQTVSVIAQNAWLWFLTGALFALFVYLIWNLAKRR
jgi:DNA-binding transcriptional ArsR family regulator